MQRPLFFTAPLLVVLMACDENPASVTQHMLYCEETSSALISDLEAIPEGFSLSPLDAIDGLSGFFIGTQKLEEGEPVGESASLITRAASEDVYVIRYKPSDSEVDPIHCPPNYTTELEFELTADGVPDLQASLSARIDIDGGAYAQGIDLVFDGSLPGPSTFNPDDFDTVQSQVSFASSRSDSWAVSIGWVAMNLDGVEEGQDVPQEGDTILEASLEAE